MHIEIRDNEGTRTYEIATRDEIAHPLATGDAGAASTSVLTPRIKRAQELLSAGRDLTEAEVERELADLDESGLGSGENGILQAIYREIDRQSSVRADLAGMLASAKAASAPASSEAAGGERVAADDSKREESLTGRSVMMARMKHGALQTRQPDNGPPLSGRALMMFRGNHGGRSPAEHREYLRSAGGSQ